jgi:uncharacterized protein YecT (DUF1311 family)
MHNNCLPSGARPTLFVCLVALEILSGGWARAQTVESPNCTRIPRAIARQAIAESHDQTQLEMNDDARRALEKADQRLNLLYNKILREYRNDKLFIQKLQAAEKAWILFRDAHVASRFPEPDEQANYGSVCPMCKANILKELTEQRINQLKEWLDGTEEGDVCAGSIHRKR